jgi:hypothetical protein
MDDVSKQRLIHNEQVFRAVNDEVEALEHHYGTSSGRFVCECSDIRCADTIELPLAEYERVRVDPRRYVVLPGHETGAVEDVVERYDGYVVVRKRH